MYLFVKFDEASNENFNCNKIKVEGRLSESNLLLLKEKGKEMFG